MILAKSTKLILLEYGISYFRNLCKQTQVSKPACFEIPTFWKNSFHQIPFFYCYMPITYLILPRSVYAFYFLLQSTLFHSLPSFFTSIFPFHINSSSFFLKPKESSLDLVIFLHYSFLTFLLKFKVHVNTLHKCLQTLWFLCLLCSTVNVLNKVIRSWFLLSKN